jgi:hypothetical protein
MILECIVVEGSVGEGESRIDLFRMGWDRSG